MTNAAMPDAVLPDATLPDAAVPKRSCPTRPRSTRRAQLWSRGTTWRARRGLCARQGSNTDHSPPPPPPNLQYELYAVLVHSGSASFGHYYALIKDLEHGEWHEFNDSLVKPIKEERAPARVGERCCHLWLVVVVVRVHASLSPEASSRCQARRPGDAS